VLLPSAITAIRGANPPRDVHADFNCEVKLTDLMFTISNMPPVMKQIIYLTQCEAVGYSKREVDYLFHNRRHIRYGEHKICQLNFAIKICICVAVIADGSSTACLDIFTSYMGAASPTNTAFILRTGLLDCIVAWNTRLLRIA
jgi:hypothetical protein